MPCMRLELHYAIQTLIILSGTLLNPFSNTMGLLPDTYYCGLRMRREYRERFPHHHGLATCITARALRLCRDACRDL